MATLLRGKRKGETVGIHQFANDWVSLEDGAIVSPTSLAYTPEEASRIEGDAGKGDWPYVWGYRDGMLRLKMTIDGRAAAFAKIGQRIRPPTQRPPCIVCGVVRGPTRHGRCPTCSSYLRARGVERPSRLWAPGCATCAHLVEVGA